MNMFSPQVGTFEEPLLDDYATNTSAKKEPVVTEFVTPTKVYPEKMKLSKQKSSEIRLQNLIDNIKKKTESYDSKAKVDPYKSKANGQIGFFDMTMRYATGKDKLFLALAILAMTIHGTSRPLFSVMLGKTSRTVSTADHGTGDGQQKTW